jgi:hypothetical protein
MKNFSLLCPPTLNWLVIVVHRNSLSTWKTLSTTFSSEEKRRESAGDIENDCKSRVNKGTRTTKEFVKN